MPAKQKQQNSLPSVMTNKWVFSVLHELRHGAKRFNEISRQLGTTQKVLTDTLKKLERSGIIERTVYPTNPPQVEYKLTPLGVELLKLSEIITTWTKNHQEEIRRAQKAYDKQIH